MYEGQWENKEHGIGQFVFQRCCLRGRLRPRQEVKEEKAKYSDPSDATYQGSFVAGKREGYTDPSGAVAYSGEWKDSQPADL